jgi:hypothetical protein
VAEQALETKGTGHKTWNVEWWIPDEVPDVTRR